ncbi:hypothetical protein ACX8XP_10345 [Calditrichota bacterium LG25]
MGYLRGLSNYLKENYRRDILSEHQEAGDVLDFHIHGHKTLRGQIHQNLKYDLVVKGTQGNLRQIPKVHIKFFYSAQHSSKIASFIQIDEAIKARQLQPILNPTRRYHVKNKTLYPMMMLKKPIRLTLLEGEVLQGIIGDFTVYEIILQLNDGLQVVVFRHSILQCVDPENGRNLLKSFQDEVRDWEKTPLWIDEETGE